MHARSLALAVMALLATGCATTERREEQAFTYCPQARGGAWRFLSEPPADAERTLAIAQPEPKKPYTLTRVRLFWFEDDAHRAMLCRTELDGWGADLGCWSQVWLFRHAQDGWQIDGNALEEIIVCG